VNRRFKDELRTHCEPRQPLEFWVPYGTTEVPVRVPDTNFYRILEPAKPAANTPAIGHHDSSVNRKSGRERLHDRLVNQGSTIGIVVDPAIPETSLKTIVDDLQSRLSSLGAKEVRVFVRTRHSSQIESEWKKINPQEDTFVDVGRTNHGTRVSIHQGIPLLRRKDSGRYCSAALRQQFCGRSRSCYFPAYPR